LHDHLGRLARSEAQDRRTFLAAPNSRGMIAAGSVARFTLQLAVAEWPA
jgi:hypothetical protein